MPTLLFSAVTGQAGSGVRTHMQHWVFLVHPNPGRFTDKITAALVFQSCSRGVLVHPHSCHMDNFLVGCYTPPMPWAEAAKEQSPFRRWMYEPWGECAVKYNCNICTGFSAFWHSDVTTPSLAETGCWYFLKTVWSVSVSPPSHTWAADIHWFISKTALPCHSYTTEQQTLAS